MKKQTKNEIWMITNENETLYFINAEKACEYLGVSRNAVHLAKRLGHKCQGYTVDMQTLENVEIIVKGEK